MTIGDEEARIRLRFRDDPGVRGEVEDLARREHACCGFFTFEVTAAGDEVRWDASAAPDARPVLDELFDLPVHLGWVETDRGDAGRGTVRG